MEVIIVIAIIIFILVKPPVLYWILAVVALGVLLGSQDISLANDAKENNIIEFG